MKNMKKFSKTAFSLFLALTLLCGLTACGNKNGSSSLISSAISAEESEQTALISSEADTSSKKNTSSKQKNTSSKQKTNSSKTKKSSSASNNDDDLKLSALEKAIYGVDTTMYPDSLVETGNSARIANLMKKAQNGGSYTIAVLGGSISQGAGSSGGKSYGKLVCDWWKENFPKANFTFVNAGFGASNQLMACYRMETDLLSYNPDFVVIDFTVNYTEGITLAYETIVNRVYNYKTQPAVMAIHFTRSNRKLYSSGVYEKGYTKVPDDIANALTKYKIPTVSFHDYVWKHVTAKDFKFNDVMADYIHPNVEGHTIAAGLITKHLEYVKNNTAKLAGTAPTSPTLSDKGLVNLGYMTNTSSAVQITGGFSKMENTSPVTRGWKFTAGSTGTLTLTVPSNATNVQLLMAFDSGATGKFFVKSGSLDTNPQEIRNSNNNLSNPTLMVLRADQTTYTITPDEDCGNFTVYGIAFSLK